MTHPLKRLHHMLIFLDPPSQAQTHTITLKAPIAELSIAAPAKFAEFKEEHSTKQKLGDFAGKCLMGICDDPDIQSKVQALKKERKLLPVGKGDF